MIFVRREGALGLQHAALRGLRLSRNTPLVDGGDLPVGPARAAIAVHEQPGAGLQVTVGVRSQKSGEVALYECRDASVAGAPLAQLLDAALCFGESMGFVFDEDEIRPGDAESRALAEGLWEDLMGEGVPALELTEPLPPLAGAADAAAESLGASVPPPGPAVRLSKFRRASDTGRVPLRTAPEGAGDEPSGSPASLQLRKAPLARLRLVKRRRDGGEDGRCRQAFRLLSAF